jgi:hypothetical protein
MNYNVWSLHSALSLKIRLPFLFTIFGFKALFYYPHPDFAVRVDCDIYRVCKKPTDESSGEEFTNDDNVTHNA